jgi:hypothetical protein
VKQTSREEKGAGVGRRSELYLVLIAKEKLVGK